MRRRGRILLFFLACLATASGAQTATVCAQARNVERERTSPFMLTQRALPLPHAVAPPAFTIEVEPPPTARAPGEPQAAAAFVLRPPVPNAFGTPERAVFGAPGAADKESPRTIAPRSAPVAQITPPLHALLSTAPTTVNAAPHVLIAVPTPAILPSPENFPLAPTMLSPLPAPDMWPRRPVRIGLTPRLNSAPSTVLETMLVPAVPVPIWGLRPTPVQAVNAPFLAPPETMFKATLLPPPQALPPPLLLPPE
jgi:hypothetical protein